jgi:hypothetical protein
MSRVFELRMPATVSGALEDRQPTRKLDGDCVIVAHAVDAFLNLRARFATKHAGMPALLLQVEVHRTC